MFGVGLISGIKKIAINKNRKYIKNHCELPRCHWEEILKLLRSMKVKRQSVGKAIVTLARFNY